MAVYLYKYVAANNTLATQYIYAYLSMHMQSRVVFFKKNFLVILKNQPI